MTTFFTASALDFFRNRLKNRKYRQGTPQDESDGALIKTEIFAPTNAWAYAVAEQLPTYRVREDNMWQNAGSFKEYAWARLYLREFGDQLIYFRMGVDGKGYITYNIDCYWNKLKAEESQRLRAALDSHGPAEQSIYPNDFPHYNWPRLVTETADFIKNNETFYRHLHSLLNSNMEAVQKAKEIAAAAFAAKFSNPNIILYGPPGTGKTHHTLELAYELLMGNPPTSYADAQALFQQELGKRVEFVTFHQSFGYEDFVQGIKPAVTDESELVFKTRNGIFYEIARRAREEWQQQTTPIDEPRPILFRDVYSEFLKNLVEDGTSIQVAMKTPDKFFEVLKFSDDSITFQRGTDGELVKVLNTTLEGLYNGSLIQEKPSGNQVYHQAIVKRLFEMAQAQQKISNQPQEASQRGKAPRNYVLIIDEINRANISKVFGELITLLEKDKRLGGDNPLSVTLPSGESKFNVPANLYIIGTMNTADKSIALLDIALRRRFEFQAIYPIYAQADGTPFQHATVFQQLNLNISEQKSRDFQIGHAYFMDRPNKPAEPLANILNKKVIPLLYEYFLNDDKKVKAVFKNTGVEVQEDQATGLLRYNPVA